MNYAWIKPGVKAVIMDTAPDHRTILIGEIVTISSTINFALGEPSVEVEEIEHLKNLIGVPESLGVELECRALAPLDDDNHQDDIPNWENLIKGKDVELPDFTHPVKNTEQV